MVTGRPTGHPVRCLKNKLTRQFLTLEKEAAAPEEYEKLGKGALSRAVVDGDVDYGSVMSGQIAALVVKEETCEEIIQDVISGAEKLLKDARNWYC